MWGHEYEIQKRQKRRRALITGVISLAVLALLAIPVLSFFSISSAERQLLSAARSGDATGVQGALQAGANPDVTNRRGETALHLAAWHGHTVVTRALIVGRADVNARSERSGETPLHTAVRANRPDMVLVLLGAGARSTLRTLEPTAPDVRGNRHAAGMTAREMAEAAGFDQVAIALGARAVVQP